MKKAFTLIELLVVIGIISVLVAILIPTLTGAKEKSNWIVCQSNLRQISIAMIMYSNTNKDILPKCSPFSATGYKEDWIYWQKTRELRDSALSPYMNMAKNVLICPSDNIPAHMHPTTNLNSGPYNYSYTMNINLGYGAIKTSRVVKSSTMILLVDEEDTGVDDGMWCPSWGNTDYLSTRHDKTARNQKQYATGNLMVNPKSRGNVAFLDCHVEFLSKAEAHSAKYYDPFMDRR